MRPISYQPWKDRLDDLWGLFAIALTTPLSVALP
jgi:hypothetical protein